MTMVDPGALPEHRRGAAARRAWTRRRTRIPVAPASHYVMGGIVTDLDGRALDRASTPSASAPAPACTAPTGSRRTRSASASSSAAAPRSPRSTTRPPHATVATIEADVERAHPRDPRGRLAARRASSADAERPHAAAATTRTRSPASSPPAPCTARRRAARTAAREFPETDPALDGHHTILDADTRDPALRGMDGLLIDWGGVLTPERARLVRRVRRGREGLPENTIRDAFRNDARPLVEGLENGEIEPARVRAQLARASRSRPETNLAARLMADVAPGRRDARSRQALPRRTASGPSLVCNSWRESDYDVADAFDVDRPLASSWDSASPTRASTKSRSKRSNLRQIAACSLMI